MSGISIYDSFWQQLNADPPITAKLSGRTTSSSVGESKKAPPAILLIPSLTVIFFSFPSYSIKILKKYLYPSSDGSFDNHKVFIKAPAPNKISSLFKTTSFKFLQSIKARLPIVWVLKGI